MSTWELRIVDCDGKIFCAPLALEGNESIAFARDRFVDAIYAYRHLRAKKESRTIIGNTRIDGIPTQEEIDHHAQLNRSLGLTK